MKNYTPLLLEKYRADYSLVRSSALFHSLRGVATVQQALEILDNLLVPATHYDEGLMSKADKALLDWLDLNASEKIYVYSNQEEGLIDPVTRIIVADNEGLSYNKVDYHTVRIGMQPFISSAKGSDGKTVAAKVDNKTLEFGSTDTTDVLVQGDKLFVDATKAVNTAFLYSLIFGG